MRICYHSSPSDSLANLVSLANCVGIAAELCEVENAAALIAALEDPSAPSIGGVVLDVASLKELCSQDELEKATTLICDREVSVLLLTTGVDASSDRFLQVLTNGVVLKGHHAGKPSRLEFPGGTGDLAGELSSLSYSREPCDAIGLTLSSSPNVNVIAKVGESPSFVRVRTSNASVFVWSSFRIFDVFRPLAAEKEFEDAADEYVPAIVFLRYAFGDRCWHNPTPSAGLIIDDPLLNQHYGFINFPKLLGSARAFGYHVTVAFIPWNYWRSRRKAVQWFVDHSDCFSICVHGCDHTRNEFRSADYNDLLSRNFVARQRMERHEQRTGISWEPLMVCPQEQYSLEGLRAFSDSRQFLAAVNTACIPREGSVNGLRAADLLQPAQDAFFGFPVFKRHYWQDMSVFAMALFLGKPAILVEHHEFFREGPGGVEEFVSRLKQLSPKLRWNALFETVIRTDLRRRSETGNWEIRFFTDTFHLEHESADGVEYRLTRRVPEKTIVRRVTVNGTDATFTREHDNLHLRLRVAKPQTLKIQVEAEPIQAINPYSSGLKYRASVAVRRGLSELRDNVIARNHFAFKAARSLMRLLRQTGG